MRFYETCIESCKQLEDVTSDILEGKSYEKIVIRGGDFKSASIIQFSEAIMNSKFLEVIELELNSNAGSHIWHLMSSLQCNLSLKKLKINCSEIDGEGLKSIADFLKVNTALKSLKLSYSKGDESPIIKIADALKSNTTLKKFVLSTYPFLSDKCVRAFLETMNENRCLLRVDLSSKNIRLLEIIESLCMKNEIIQRSAL